MKLTNSLLSGHRAYRYPTYDRSLLTPGIVHIGVGNFHRAHQAWYLHQLMQQGQALDWAIVGAGVRPEDARMRERLMAQDFLTTLIERNPEGPSAEVVGCMIDFVAVEEGNGALIERMAQPDIRIVSLTVTESGYYQQPSTADFDAGHVDVQHDAMNPSQPRSAFGAIVAALKIRREAGMSPFTVQSCDNVQGNGAVARQTVVSLARLTDVGLADWIDSKVSFPGSMVDCIVPRTGQHELSLAQQFGIDDAVPVTHENYRQWVMEDDFNAGRPPWEKAGAEFTNDVHDYETMKIRILNAGHQILVGAGELLSIDTVADCMAHPLVSAFFLKVEREEIAPHVSSLPGMTPQAYIHLVAQRFSNTAMHDTVRRIAYDGSARHPGFVLPVVRDAIARDESVEGLALTEALWARMCEGTREDASAIEPNDPNWQTLTLLANQAKQQPLVWLEQPWLYGDLAKDERFGRAFSHWLSLIWEQGTEAALEVYLGLR